jgi:hypothetical protein
VRQRDPMDQRSIMSIARFAGPAGHAVARQVHRRVRHPCEAEQCGDHVLDAAIARAAVEEGKPLALSSAFSALRFEVR